MQPATERPGRRAACTFVGRGRGETVLFVLPKMKRCKIVICFGQAPGLARVGGGTQQGRESLVPPSPFPPSEMDAGSWDGGGIGGGSNRQ